MNQALSAGSDGVKIKPELMKDDVLYHCVSNDRLVLMYRDSQKIMHCYEVEDPQIVKAVRSCATYDDAARLLEEIGAEQMNKVIKQDNKAVTPMSGNDDAAEIYTEYKERRVDNVASDPQEDVAPPEASASETEPKAEPAGDAIVQDGDSDEEESPAGYSTPRDAGDAIVQDGDSDPIANQDDKGSDESSSQDGDVRDRSVIFIGIKPIMTYVTATLTQLATLPKITIKSRGKRITQAVDVSQMIVKRMNTVGYKIADVRISSDEFTGDDGRNRKISTMEIDITKE